MGHFGRADGEIVRVRGSGRLLETVLPRNVGSCTHEVSSTCLPEYALNNDDGNRRASWTWEAHEIATLHGELKEYQE